ncbi:MAG: cyanophycinase, partial [Bacteroidia bacterium]
MKKRFGIPKGTLLIIGGAEDKGEEGQLDISDKNKDFQHLEILSELIPAKKNGRAVEIITTASSQPEAVSEMYKSAFDKIGFKKAAFINMGDNYDAANPLFIKRIQKAHAVLFSGGDQFRLSTILGNTDVLDAIVQRYYDDPDFIVAGTSAGAMASAAIMMFEGESNEALLKGAVKLSSGFGLIDGCIVDTHFVKRGRFGRLALAVVMNPTCIG